MTLTRSAEQEQFAASLHDMLAAADVPGAARDWADGDPAGALALWRKLAEAGVTALAVPERWGGLGPARWTSWSPARNSGTTRCRGRWPSRWPWFRG